MLLALLAGTQLSAYDIVKAAQGGSVAMIKQAIAEGQSVNTINEKRMTPLFIAAARGKYAAVKFLLENGATVDLSGTGQTPLGVAKFAASQNTSGQGATYKKIVDLLTEYGAKDSALSTPATVQSQPTMMHTKKPALRPEKRSMTSKNTLTDNQIKAIKHMITRHREELERLRAKGVAETNPNILSHIKKIYQYQQKLH